MNAEVINGGDAPRNPDAIERQNDALRADMSRTIEALEQKLSPGQLLDRGLGLLKEHGGEWAAQLGNTVKRNPVPSILTVVGIAWLMTSSRRTTAHYAVDVEPRDDDELSGFRSERWKDRFENAGERIGQVRSTAADMAHQLGERASTARARLHDTAESVRQTAHRAANQARAAEAKLESTFREQPLLIGALGVALGAILGSMLPGTRSEDRLMGDARDRTLEKARAAGEQKYEQVREKVKEVADSVTQRAKTTEEQRHH